jgi:PAS domain S-box-containing protein
VSVEQFLQIANLLPGGCLLVTGEGIILAANRAAETMIRGLEHGTQTRRIADLTVDSADALREYLRLCARSREPVLGAINIGGTVYQCEGGLLEPRHGEEPALLLLRLTSRDASAAQFVALNQRIEQLNREILRRQRIEQELQQERQKLQVTLLSIGDAVITTDPRGRVQLVNPVAAALTGWPQADAEGRPLEEVFRIIDEETQATVEAPVRRVVREGAVVGLANHATLIHRDGSERPIDDSAAPIRNHDGSLQGVVLVFRDVTERRRAEGRLRALNESLEQRVAERTAVAEQRARQLHTLAVELTEIEQRERRRLAVLLHDHLQQILVAAAMQLSMARRQPSRLVEEKIADAGNLVRQAIETSRSLAIELAPPVLYDAGLRAALRWLARWSEDRWGLRVDAQIAASEEPGRIETSAFLLQAARELLLNVVKHSGAREAALRFSNPAPGLVEIAVEDSGSGFEPDAIEQEPGDRFGLMSIRERIRRLGGRVEIASTPGRGTLVRLVCPTNV